MSQDTARQGQMRGQGQERTAKECLSDLEYVQGLREAAKAPATWACVDLTVQAELFSAEKKITTLGGSRDDLLVMLLEAIEALRHKGNQNFARHTSPLQWVNQELDWRVKLCKDDEADRGRRILVPLKLARDKTSVKAGQNAAKLEAAVKALVEADDITREKAYQILDERKATKPGTTKKKIMRARRRSRARQL